MSKIVKNKKISVLACRVCLSLEKNNKVVMDAGNEWPNLFTYCFGLEINPREQARALCEKCADSIRNFAILKVKCMESDRVWKSVLKAPKFKMELRNDNDILKIENKNLLKLEELKEKNIIDPIESQNDDDESCCLIELNDSDDSTMKSVNTPYVGPEDLKEIDSSKVTQESGTIIKNDSNERNYSRDESAENDTISNDGGGFICFCGCSYMHKTAFTKHTKKCAAWKFCNSRGNLDVLKMCGLCKFSTHDAKILIRHFNEHYKNNDLHCKLCDYIGQDFACMAFHRYTHMPAERSKLFCLTCFKSCLNPKSLQFHFRVKHLKKEKGGLCGYCGDEYASVNKWRFHEKMKHSDLGGNNDVYICDCCGLTFMYRSFIVEHLRIRAGLCKISCDQCGKVFLCRRYLKRHMTVHTGTQRVKCTECEKTLTPASLPSHKKHTHGAKNYVCEFCSAKYASLKSFKYHMLNHTTYRPYKCHFCDAGYKKNNLLIEHIRSKHTGERPFQCAVCLMRFTRAMTLKIHQAVHTKIRTYQCKISGCDKSFYNKKILLRHYAKAHPDTASPEQ